MSDDDRIISFKRCAFSTVEDAKFLIYTGEEIGATDPDQIMDALQLEEGAFPLLYESVQTLIDYWTRWAKGQKSYNIRNMMTSYTRLFQVWAALAEIHAEGIPPEDDTVLATIAVGDLLAALDSSRKTDIFFTDNMARKNRLLPVLNTYYSGKTLFNNASEVHTLMLQAPNRHVFAMLSYLHFFEAMTDMRQGEQITGEPKKWLHDRGQEFIDHANRFATDLHMGYTRNAIKTVLSELSKETLLTFPKGAKI